MRRFLVWTLAAATILLVGGQQAPCLPLLPRPSSQASPGDQLAEPGALQRDV